MITKKQTNVITVSHQEQILWLFGKRVLEASDIPASWVIKSTTAVICWTEMLYCLAQGRLLLLTKAEPMLHLLVLVIFLRNRANCLLFTAPVKSTHHLYCYDLAFLTKRGQKRSCQLLLVVLYLRWPECSECVWSDCGTKTPGSEGPVTG